jgi:hypothetical protein
MKNTNINLYYHSFTKRNMYLFIFYINIYVYMYIHYAFATTFVVPFQNNHSCNNYFCLRRIIKIKLVSNNRHFKKMNRNYEMRMRKCNEKYMYARFILII